MVSVKIDPPFVTGEEPREQLYQLVRYLQRLAEQLNMAFEELEVMALGQN